MNKILGSLFIICIIAFQAEYVRADGHLEFTGTAKYNEQPVSDATATLYVLGDKREKVSSVTTGYNGQFSFKTEFDKMYRIVWQKSGYTEMVILINGFVPASEKGWIMSYSLSFDIFKHKEGHETKLANEPVIQVSYSAKAENFSQVKAYTNSSTYVRLEDNVKPTSADPKEVKAVVNESNDKIAKEESPVTEEEKEFVKETEGQIKQAEFKKEIAESAAGDRLEEERAAKQQEKALEEKRIRDLKASQLKESLAAEKERARKEEVKNRSARSNSQQSLMMEIADMMKEEKQKKP